MQSFQEEDYTKRFDLSLWLKLLRIAKPYHKNLWIIGVFMGISAIIDVIMPLMNSYAIDNYIARGDMAGVGRFAAFYVAMVAL